MTTGITGVFTNIYKRKYASKTNTNLVFVTSLNFAYFKIGELGHVGTVPKVPDPDRTDIEATYEQGTLPPPPGPDLHISYFKKLFSPGDVTVADAIVTAVCLLLAAEGNDDGLGNTPIYYELGIFDIDNTMIAYFTFDGEQKTDARSLQHTVTIDFQEV